MINGRKGIAQNIIYLAGAIGVLIFLSIAITSITALLNTLFTHFTSILIGVFVFALVASMLWFFYNNRELQLKKALGIAVGFTLIILAVVLIIPYVINIGGQAGQFYTADAEMTFRLYCSESGGILGEACVETTMSDYSIDVKNFQKTGGVVPTSASPSLCILWGCDKHVQFSGTIEVYCNDEKVSTTPITVDEIYNVPDTGISITRTFKLVNLPLGENCEAITSIGSKTTFIEADQPKIVEFTVPAN